MEQEQALWGLETDLAYFAAMQESQPKDRPDHSAKKWDQRAEAWEKERREKQKGEARVRSAVAYLEEQGLLRPDFQVADVGCGPGRFAVAFARRVRWVTGFDLSPRMIHYGLEYARREGVANLTLQALDFQTLEVEAAGLRRAFDLVFSSLTPAVHGQAGLEKMMDMSRAYCCNITHLYHRNSICRQLQEEVFGIPLYPLGAGVGFIPCSICYCFGGIFPRHPMTGSWRRGVLSPARIMQPCCWNASYPRRNGRKRIKPASLPGFRSIPMGKGCLPRPAKPVTGASYGMCGTASQKPDKTNMEA